ncbi:MAG: threonine/serine exporter family protein [Spirochaetia bacterium]|nr:threonine/serine exporter family protein [Spirochaetia bacterium]
MSECDDQTDRILSTAMEAGMIILKNGGETYRCEEIMCSVANMLGARNVSAFVTPTVVMLTCEDDHGHTCTHFQRILNRTINLSKISRLENEVMRMVSSCKPHPLKMVESVFRRIDSSIIYPDWAIVLTIALGSFCFSLLFGGSIVEAITAFVIGTIMRIVLFTTTPLELPGFLTSIIGGFIISMLSGLAARFGIIPSISNVIISVLMTLVPGVILVNAIRDIIAGDLVAGTAKLLEAFVIAAALSIGAAFGLIPFASETSKIAPVKVWDSLVPAFLAAFFTTAAFAYFFYIPKYDIFLASLLGAAGWIIFLILNVRMGYFMGGYFVGAFCIGVLSEIFGSVLKKPATIFIIPAIIPFVPGGGIYETMLYSLWGNMQQAGITGFRTLTASGAIAAGIALASAFAHTAKQIKKLKDKKTCLH